MPQKQRQIKVEQKSALSAMERMQTRSDEELQRETRYRAAANAILGARAAERYDAKACRAYFEKAITAARPQERMQLRRMASASLALAERRAGDLKDAVQKLGHEPPSARQLLALRFMGLVAPPPGANALLRIRGVLILLAVVALLLVLGLGIVELVALPFGGVSVGGGILLGLLVVIAALGVMAFLGRRRQAKAREASGAPPG